MEVMESAAHGPVTLFVQLPQ